jgi:hypothetical protein
MTNRKTSSDLSVLASSRDAEVSQQLQTLQALAKSILSHKGHKTNPHPGVETLVATLSSLAASLDQVYTQKKVRPTWQGIPVD